MEEVELSALLDRIRRGDPAAFETIHHRFRNAALSWARAIVRDPYLADDVVQEAFLRMREKLEQLKDDRKFTAWFRLLVRRLALNSIRGTARKQEREHLDVGELELDSEKFGVVHGSVQSRQLLLEQEESVKLAMGKLTRQAMELLHASALEEASPDELAERFQMKKSNVYNIVSRSRNKVNDERFAAEIETFVAERRARGEVVEAHLAKPDSFTPHAFLSVMIGAALRTVGESRFSYTELMGVSGDAFRLVMPVHCNWRQILMYDWSLSAYRTMERLGYSGMCMGRPQRRSFTPDLQAQLLSVVQGSIDRGIPAIIRNMEINEMGFACGYDDRSRQVHYVGNHGRERLFRYDQIGRTAEDQPVFVLGLRGRVTSPMASDDALRAIVRHAHGQEPPIAGYAYGLDGYRVWLEAVESNRLDLHGHAYLVAILAEARQQAAEYLALAGGEERRGEMERELLLEASGCYRIVSEAFRRIYPRFPFGYGGSTGGRLQTIREQLEIACEAERQGIAKVEACLRR
ncbi:RNA polymerase sigma factor [Paenibacillus koleovorans]|uniref:RNA polymerase sigma factor n=1 Tax=Paenibacillus koleovorans TaxID=121608 RepID=UPI000FDB7674|nr:RNA polymerase sigma factor [Paenibacillus koleovorans]